MSRDAASLAWSTIEVDNGSSGSPGSWRAAEGVYGAGSSSPTSPVTLLKQDQAHDDAPKRVLVPTLPVVTGAVAAWAPGGDGVMLFDSSSGRLQWVQPSGPRREGEGITDSGQAILGVEHQTGGILLRVTLLAAGFVIGPSGITVRELAKQTGTDIKSWTEPGTSPDGKDLGPVRVFFVQGDNVLAAAETICAAVERYKDLCEGRYKGRTVTRLQTVRGTDFMYHPPPRQKMPGAATIAGAPINRAALVYGAKHGGFTSLRQLPGLMGGGGGRPSSPASVPHGVAGGDGRHPSLGSGGWAGLDANNGAPSAAYGPIGGPCTGSTARTTIYNASSAATAMYGDYGGVAPGLHSPPQTPSPLAPQPTKRSSRIDYNWCPPLSLSQGHTEMFASGQSTPYSTCPASTPELPNVAPTVLDSFSASPVSSADMGGTSVGFERGSSGLDDCAGFGRHICSAYGLGSLPHPNVAGATASVQRTKAASEDIHGAQFLSRR